MGGHRPFSEAEAREHRLMVEKRVNRASTEGGYLYYLNGNQQQYYADGYLYKPVSLKSLLLVEGLPPVDEITRYNQVCLACSPRATTCNIPMHKLLHRLVVGIRQHNVVLTLVAVGIHGGARGRNGGRGCFARLERGVLHLRGIQYVAVPQAKATIYARGGGGAKITKQTAVPQATATFYAVDGQVEGGSAGESNVPAGRWGGKWGTG